MPQGAWSTRVGAAVQNVLGAANGAASGDQGLSCLQPCSTCLRRRGPAARVHLLLLPAAVPSSPDPLPGPEREAAVGCASRQGGLRRTLPGREPAVAPRDPPARPHPGCCLGSPIPRSSPSPGECPPWALRGKAGLRSCRLPPARSLLGETGRGVSRQRGRCWGCPGQGL